MDAISEAQAPTTFDVLSFVEGTAYPVETVKIYTDVKAVAELLEANQARLSNDIHKDDPRDFDAIIEDATARVNASALTFDLRGMPPGIVQELYASTEGETAEQVQEKEDALVARTIVDVRNADGIRDPRLWSGEDVAKLRRFVKEGEFGKLIQGVVNVNFNAAIFDQATDAGFLGGSADVAS